MNVFMRVAWVLSQFTVFALKFQQKNIRGQKSIVWETALVPLYKTTLFLACLMVVSTEMGYQYVSSLTATACFIFVNHASNAFFNGVGMCCMCLLF